MARTEAQVNKEAAIDRYVEYTHASAVSAGELLYVDGLGALKAMAAYGASVKGLYMCGGIISVPITAAVTITQGQKVCWDVSANTANLSNASALTVGDFFLGTAIAAGTAAGGYVDVMLNADLGVQDAGYKTLVASGTVTVEDRCLVLDGTAAVVTATLPDAATSAKLNHRITFICKNADNTITIARAGSDTIMGATSIVLNVRESVTLVPIGTDWIAESNAYEIGTAAIGTGAVGTTNLAAYAVTSAKLASDCVFADKISDNAVSLEHLDSGITPSHICVAIGSHTTVGGDNAETITVSGLLSTDKVVAVIASQGGTPKAISVYTWATDGQIAVTMLGDPSTDHRIDYVAFRAVA